MIICINREIVPGKGAGVSRVVLQADKTEDIATSKPTTGEGVQDIPATAVFYAGSILVCLEDSKKYVLGTDNVWYEMK